MKESLFHLYFRKYKNYLLPLSLFVTSVFIVFQIILPQYFAILDKNNEINKRKAEIAELNSSLNSISSINGSDIAENLDAVNKTLPASKDIIGMYTSLSSISSKTGVELRSFSVKPGGVYSSEKPALSSFQNNASTLTVLADLHAPSYENFIAFSKNLYSSSPLLEIKKLQISGQDARMELNFFYKPYDVSSLAKQERIPPLSAQETKLLLDVKEWSK